MACHIVWYHYPMRDIPETATFLSVPLELLAKTCCFATVITISLKDILFHSRALEFSISHVIALCMHCSIQA